MNKKLIVIVFLLWSSAYCAFGQANQWGPFDPGALRNDGSNASSAATVRDNLGLGTMAVATSTDYVATDTFTAHTSATGTAVHGLGTMAAEAATDYVATDTFTDHTDATGSSVHGLGTISTKADTDYVATSSLAARLDTINASFTGDIDVTGDVGAATVNGVAPLTSAEKTQALVGSDSVAFRALKITGYDATTTKETVVGLVSTSGFFKAGGFFINAGATSNVASLTQNTSLSAAKITLINSGTAREAADIYLPSSAGASSSIIIWQSSENLFATSDTASKVSVYKSGSDWVIKNNSTARTFFYHIVGTGNGANP